MTTALVRPEAKATITVKEPVVVVPSVPVYTNDGTSSSGWTVSFSANGSGATGASIALSSGGSTPSRLYLFTQGGVTTVNPTPSVTASRTITGFTVGRAATLSGVVQASGAARIRLRIGSNATPWHALTTEGTVSVAFTPATTSLVLYIEIEDNPSSSSSSTAATGYIDNIRIEHSPITTLTPELTITQGKVSLDENYSPYAMARVTVPMTSEEVLEQIDPRDNQRITIATTEATSGVTREYDLQLRSRSADHKALSIDLELASDELMLHDRVNVSTSVDNSPRQYESSLRSVCEWALGKIPSVVRNLIANPRGNVATNWAATVGSGAASAVTTATMVGMNVGGLGIDTFLRAEATSAGTYIDLRNPTQDGVLTGAGGSVTASAWVRPSSISGVTGRVYVQFYNASNTLISTITSDPFTLTSGAWTRIYATGAIPTGATRTYNVFRAVGTVTSGSRLDATAFLVEESPRLNPFKEKVLVAGTADADVTARWSAENAILNPNVANLTGYAGAGNCNLTHGTTANAGVEGTTGFAIATAPAAGQSFVSAPQTVSTRKGDMWTFSCYMFRGSGMPAVNGILRVYEMDSSSGILRKIESTPKVIPLGGSLPYTWDRYSVTFTVQNPNTSKLAVYGSYMATAAGQSVGMDGFTLTQGPLLLPFFSGATVPAGYVTNWTGEPTAPNNSVSERRPANGVERLPELFDWKPGQSLFDFLQPLINASGLRLFCDESRVWRLVNPNEYEVPGYVVAQAKFNATEGEDLITRNEDTWADAVVVIYSWSDSGGESKTAYDVAGDPTGKAVVRELSREYPGPGAAQHILNSLQGRGRTQTVTVLGQYGATPGQDATISLPGTYPQTGKVRRVTFDLSSGLMDVETRGLTDALPGSWATWNPSQKWVDVTPTLKWKDA